MSIKNCFVIFNRNTDPSKLWKWNCLPTFKDTVKILLKYLSVNVVKCLHLFLFSFPVTPYVHLWTGQQIVAFFFKFKITYYKLHKFTFKYRGETCAKIPMHQLISLKDIMVPLYIHIWFLYIYYIRSCKNLI